MKSTNMIRSLSTAFQGCQVDSQRACKAAFSIVWLIALCLAFMGIRPVCAQDLPRIAPAGLVWEADLGPNFSYDLAVRDLFFAYEKRVGQALKAGSRGNVAIKVNTRAGRGLSTPLPLLQACIKVLKARGYAADQILIIDYSAHALRQARILPPLSSDSATFEGARVIALDSGKYFEEDWFYDSPLPPAYLEDTQLFGQSARRSLAEGSYERKSFLAAPLLFEVDFWINLAVGVDDPALGVDGVLANATLWNVSNSQRFLANPATASAAVAEIAAIPELQERMVLHFISLERYQFIAGPFFNSHYSRSESRLWMSSDPVALDRLIYDKMNELRLLEGFPDISPTPRQLPFAARLGLGTFDRDRIRIERIDNQVEAENIPEVSGETP
ncbi:MAG: DUF362 domain-containing protein [Verrucomicrobiota bacterium]